MEEKPPTSSTGTLESFSIEVDKRFPNRDLNSRDRDFYISGCYDSDKENQRKIDILNNKISALNEELERYKAIKTNRKYSYHWTAIPRTVIREYARLFLTSLITIFGGNAISAFISSTSISVYIWVSLVEFSILNIFFIGISLAVNITDFANKHLEFKELIGE
ncbi:MAG: hypothetical protein GY771_11125 [bacterium]|nr:hypothetical protein [bacterium]